MAGAGWKEGKEEMANNIQSLHRTQAQATALIDATVSWAHSEAGSMRAAFGRDERALVPSGSIRSATGSACEEVALHSGRVNFTLKHTEIPDSLIPIHFPLYIDI